MDAQISRTLAEGMVAGLNPKDIADNLVERVESLGLNRARMLARTEVINAHAEGTLNTLESFGIEEVTAQVELVAAMDERTCAVCEGLNGTVFTIKEARGVIPVHPNCRCTWVPVV